MKRLINFFVSFFGCTHKHTTWPIRPRNSAFTYIRCLDCGAWREYNLLDQRSHCDQ